MHSQGPQGQLKCLCCKEVINPSILHRVSYYGRVFYSIYHNFKFYPVYSHMTQMYDDAFETRSVGFEWISKQFQEPLREKTGKYFFSELTAKERTKIPTDISFIGHGDVVPSPKFEKYLSLHNPGMLSLMVPVLEVPGSAPVSSL